MRISSIPVILIAALAIGSAAFAQKTPDVAEVSAWEVKAGAGAAFVAGRKVHMDFHRAQKDTWTWLTWEVVNGDRAGTYLTGTFGHYWKDLDGREAFDQLDTADSAKNMIPHADITNTSTYVHLADASRPTPNATTPAAYSQVTYFYVNPADTVRFEAALKEIKGALDKIQWPVYSNWYRLVTGGEGPLYVLATARANWAAFAPLDKTLLEGLTDAMGADKAKALLDSANSSTRKVKTEVLAFRPELSYIPAPK